MVSLAMSERRPKGTPKWRASVEEFNERVRPGRVTLLLGAGISIPAKIADWASLAKRIDPSIDVADARLRAEVPLLFQMAFERLAARDPRFQDTLRAALYRDAIAPDRAWLDANADSSLAVFARLLVAERRRPRSRVERVVTFNADDLLESAVDALRDESERVLWPIVRGSDRPFRDEPAIPVYHAHGFLPRDPSSRKDAPESLVFTDLQYWSTVAEPSSFANRVLANALHDGPCVFVGLSMTDVNLARWLALRTLEVQDAKARQFVDASPRELASKTQDALVQHFWVRPAVDPSDPNASRAPELISEWLYARGVKTVEITSWRDRSLRALIEGAFDGP